MHPCKVILLSLLSIVSLCVVFLFPAILTVNAIASSDNITIHRVDASNSLIVIGTDSLSSLLVCQGRLGDVNGDGLLDARDITRLERVIAKLNQSGNADVNGDGRINAIDIPQLERLICGLGD